MSQTTLKFDVPDMDCQSCVRSITAAVHQVDAKAEVSADLESKRVAVSGTGSAEAFAAAIENAGFTARPS
jgi:copper chaperone CopZ